MALLRTNPVKLEIKLGRIKVLIGAMFCGKSNLLEAVVVLGSPHLVAWMTRPSSGPVCAPASPVSTALSSRTS